MPDEGNGRFFEDRNGDVRGAVEAREALAKIHEAGVLAPITKLPGAPTREKVASRRCPALALLEAPPTNAAEKNAPEASDRKR